MSTVDNAMRTAYKLLPVISDYCIGCGACVEACDHECLEMVRNFARLQGSEDCVSEGDCVEVCPVEGIRMDWVKMTATQERGCWCETPPPPEPAPSRRKFWLWRLFESG